MNDKQLIKIVKANPKTIRYIDNPSEKVQLAAVNVSGTALQYIENPSYNVQLAAIKDWPYVIGMVSDPSLELQTEAVKRDIYALLYIKQPDIEVIKYVINEIINRRNKSNNEELINHIKKSSKLSDDIRLILEII